MPAILGYELNPITAPSILGSGCGGPIWTNMGTRQAVVETGSNFR